MHTSVTLLIALLSAFSIFFCEANCDVDVQQRTDCGYIGIQQSECESKGCCWSPTDQEGPWCFTAAVESTYELHAPLSETPTGLSGLLNLKSASGATYGDDLPNLSLEIIFEADSYIHIKITDDKKSRWEVPQSIVQRPQPAKSTNPGYDFMYTQSPFSFEVKRKSDGASVFKSANSLIFKDQYIELTSIVDPASKTFGLGESARLNHALTPGHTYTLWAADIPALSLNSNLYGINSHIDLKNLFVIFFLNHLSSNRLFLIYF